MSLLRQEIDQFTDTHPDVSEGVLKDEVEIEIKDAGSARAAQVALRAFGGLIAQRRVDEFEGKPGKSGQPMAASFLQGEARSALSTLDEELSLARFATEKRRSQNGFTFRVADYEADILVDTLRATPELVEQSREVNPQLAYYAGVLPRLIEEAQLSVDGDRFKYSV